MYILGTFVAAVLIAAGLPFVPGQQWTADDLYTDRPFGNIAVERAGISQKDFQLFFDDLSDQQRAKIRSRCSVIGRDGRFAKWVSDFCVKIEAARQRLSHPVTIVIDETALARVLGERAINNRSKESKVLRGIIRGGVHIL
jgi:hypothetical protein